MEIGRLSLLFVPPTERRRNGDYYDENYRLAGRIGMDGTFTEFSYNDNGQLAEVRQNGHRLVYSYDTYLQVDTININGVIYDCELDDTGSITKLIDTNGKVAVQYVYSDNIVSEVWGLNSVGELVDCTNDPVFVGNLNQVTYASYYFDVDTRWYYCGRFYDVVGGRYINGQVGLVDEFLTEVNSSGIAPASLTADTVLTYGEYLYIQCSNDASFGPTIEAYGSNWYAGLGDIDILARTIAGETLAVDDDETGVTYVLWNRKKQGFATTLRAVATSGAFQAISGNASQTYRARTPNWGWTSWDRSLQKACYLYAAEVLGSEAGLIYVLPKPSGYGDQVYYCAYSSFVANLQDDLYHEAIGIQVTKMWIPGGSTYTTYSSAASFYSSNQDRNVYLSIN